MVWASSEASSDISAHTQNRLCISIAQLSVSKIRPNNTLEHMGPSAAKVRTRGGSLRCHRFSVRVFLHRLYCVVLSAHARVHAYELCGGGIYTLGTLSQRCVNVDWTQFNPRVHIKRLPRVSLGVEVGDLYQPNCCISDEKLIKSTSQWD